MELLNKEVTDHGLDQNRFIKDKELLQDYEEILAKEETFSRQKSRDV